jgi:ABC-type lipoprotein release transport system permease subunit
MRRDGGPQAAGRLWSRRELGRRRWSLLALGVMTGLAAALALAALAGARRSDAAYDRLAEVTGAADAVIFASQVDIYAPDWEPIAELPYVEAAGSFGLPFVSIVDGPVDLGPDAGMFSVPFGVWRTDVDRPVITEGRAPDPTNPHEVLAPANAGDFGIEVGQTFTIRLPSEEQVAAFDFFSAPEGERVDIEVVGLGSSTFELAIVPGDGTGFVATQAFDDEYGQGITFIDNLMVRFRPGQGSIEELERDARRIFDSPRLPVLDAEAVAKRVTNGTELEATGLALFGLAVAAAGAVLVGQALTRSVRSGAGDLPVLRTMGFARADAALALGQPHVVVVVVGTVVALAGAALLSSRFPIGLSRRVDPDVGFHLDWLVLGPGLLLMAAVLTATIAVTAWRASRGLVGLAAPRRSRLVHLLGGAGAPAPLSVGASLALEPGRDRRALPTRPALVGVVVGVMGVVGAQTLLAGMDDAIGDPARFGATWDVETGPLDVAAMATLDEVYDDLDSVEGIDASAQAGRALIVLDDVTQPTYSITPRQGSLDFTVLEGRRPAGYGEIALGPETADAYGLGIGDSITGRAFGGEERELRIVGIALLPTTPHSSYDQGAWVAPEELEQLAGAPPGAFAPGMDPETETPPIAPTYLATVDPSADVEEVVERLNATVDPTLFAATPTTEPIDIQNLRNVRSLPLLFAIFTLVLAVGTVAHVCASVVRRRGGDLAVLRALGMTPRGTRAALAWQATTLAVIGVVVGVPLGLVIGRSSWQVVAELTPLVFTPPTAVVVLLLVAPLTVLAANVLAWWPGRRAARIRPATLLRAE